MITKTRKEVTEAVLSALPDDQWKFPGSLESQSYRKLETMGFAESVFMRVKRNNIKGTTELRPAYKRTPKGKDAASSE